MSVLASTSNSIEHLILVINNATDAATAANAAAAAAIADVNHFSVCVHQNKTKYVAKPKVAADDNWAMSLLVENM